MKAWYEERSPLSAAAFAHEVASAISRIKEAPTRYPAAEHGTRGFVLQRFPFNIFYRVGASEIVIVAVAHQKTASGLLAPTISGKLGIEEDTRVDVGTDTRRLV